MSKECLEYNKITSNWCFPNQKEEDWCPQLWNEFKEFEKNPASKYLGWWNVHSQPN